MERNIKKQQKRLKREIKKRNDKEKPRNRWWAAIYCTHENYFIGISYAPIKLVWGQGYKVDAKDWIINNNCAFKTIQHVINLAHYSKGKQVLCSCCGYPVDFRLWRSATKPELVDIVYDNSTEINKLPDTQNP